MGSAVLFIAVEALNRIWHVRDGLRYTVLCCLRSVHWENSDIFACIGPWLHTDCRCRLAWSTYTYYNSQVARSLTTCVNSAECSVQCILSSMLCTHMHSIMISSMLCRHIQQSVDHSRSDTQCCHDSWMCHASSTGALWQAKDRWAAGRGLRPFVLSQSLEAFGHTVSDIFAYVGHACRHVWST